MPGGGGDGNEANPRARVPAWLRRAWRRPRLQPTRTPPAAVYCEARTAARKGRRPNAAQRL